MNAECTWSKTGTTRAIVLCLLGVMEDSGTKNRPIIVGAEVTHTESVANKWIVLCEYWRSPLLMCLQQGRLNGFATLLTFHQR